MMESDKGRIGASFAAFLDEQGILEEVEGQAVKELIAEQISAAMKEEGLSKVAMARRMHDPRPAGSLSRPGQPVRHAGHLAASSEGCWPAFDDFNSLASVDTVSACKRFLSPVPQS